MKEFKDLKVGDRVYYVRLNGSGGKLDDVIEETVIRIEPIDEPVGGILLNTASKFCVGNRQLYISRDDMTSAGLFTGYEEDEKIYTNKEHVLNELKYSRMRYNEYFDNMEWRYSTMTQEEKNSILNGMCEKHTDQ